MAKSKIEWTDVTWNPVTGCSPLSPGCAHCYARRMAKRLAGRCGYPAAPHEFEVTLHPERLSEPLGWKKPRRVFVVSMGDLFHEDVPDEYVDAVFAVMAAAEQHTFQVLTKRPERMYQWLQSLYTRSLRYPALGKRSVSYTYGQIGEMLRAGALEYGVQLGPINRFFPLANVWLGVTVENQEQANQRVPVLLAAPGEVRFVSVEPMLGPVDLTSLQCERLKWDALTGYQYEIENAGSQRNWQAGTARLNWVICGGETGPGARPMHPDWVKALREQCQTADVPFFFKQWGDRPDATVFETQLVDERGNLKHNGRMLDGQVWNEYPWRWHSDYQDMR